MADKASYKSHDKNLKQRNKKKAFGRKKATLLFIQEGLLLHHSNVLEINKTKKQTHTIE